MLSLFSGGSPILPPALNYILLNLIKESGSPDSNKSDEERAVFDMQRAFDFKFLHEHFERQTHLQALRIIKEAWDTHAQFGLYLRNFSLGTVNSDPFPIQEEEGQYNVLTDVSTADLRLQLSIAKHISGLMPIIGIENPAYDPRHENGLPKLSLDNDAWGEIAQDLIGAAEVIIVYYDQPSPGVNIELETIRSLGRQASTLIVRPSGSLLSSIDEINDFRHEPFFTVPLPQIPNSLRSVSNAAEEFADFPCMVSWDESGHAVKRLKGAFKKMPRGTRVFSDRCPAPAVPQAPDSVKEWAQTSIRAHQFLAKSETENGNLAKAEDQFTACLVMSFWGDSPAIRAHLFFLLAYLQWEQGKFEFVTENLERALDLYERLPVMDYSSISRITSTLRQHRKIYRIRMILKRIDALQDRNADSS